MNRKLNIASFLLASNALLPIVSALLMLFSDSSEFTYSELLGVTSHQIHDFSPKLMKAIELVVQLRGLYLLVFALFWLVISLIPIRKGEKWAWLAILLIGSIWLLGYLFLVSTGLEEGIYLITWLVPGIIWVVIWTLALAIAAKEIFKPSQN